MFETTTQYSNLPTTSEQSEESLLDSLWKLEMLSLGHKGIVSAAVGSTCIRQSHSWHPATYKEHVLLEKPDVSGDGSELRQTTWDG